MNLPRPTCCCCTLAAGSRATGWSHCTSTCWARELGEWLGAPKRFATRAVLGYRYEALTTQKEERGVLDEIELVLHGPTLGLIFDF